MIRRLLMPVLEILSASRFWSIYYQKRFGKKKHDTLRLLCNLIEHAKSHVPLWQERFERLGASRPISPDTIQSLFTELPLTSKADIRSGFPDQVTSAGFRKDWRYGNSAGTIDRVTIVSDFKKRDYQRATNLRIVDLVVGDPLAARIVEVPPDACNIVCALRDEGPIDLVPFIRWAVRKRILFKAETRPDLRGRIERSLIVRQDTLEPLPPCSIEQLTPQLDSHLDKIQALRPNILRGLPLYLLWLAERAKERNFTVPNLKSVMPYGGLTGTAMAKRISDAFGVPYVDYYGTSEVGGIAIQPTEAGEKCKLADLPAGLRVLDDLVMVEILDENNQPLPAGKIGKIVVTDFHNYAMPLIRYEIGDYGQWISELTTSDQFQLCREGLLQIVGRRVEIQSLRSGAWVTARSVLDTLFADPVIQNACIEERTPKKSQRQYSLTYVGHDAIGNTTVQAIEQLLEMDTPLSVRRTSYLRPESSGKYVAFRPLSTSTGPMED